MNAASSLDLKSGPILTHASEGILLVTFNRSPANAIDAQTSRLLAKVISEFECDRSMRAMIITGGNSRFFSAGWDLKAAANGDDRDHGEGGFAGLKSLLNLNKPVITAVNGFAAGGGAEIALSGDIVICSESAKIALPGVSVSVLPETAAVTLRRKIPHYIAMELLLTGRWFTPVEALAWGCCNYVVPAEDLAGKAMEIARKIVLGAPLVQAAVKEIARETEAMSSCSALEFVGAQQLPSVKALYNSSDYFEGPKAFAEKRVPVWKGA